VSRQIPAGVASVVEPTLGNSPNQWHLATLKPDADRTARPGGLAFAAATAGLAMAGGFALSQPFAWVLGARARFKIVKSHKSLKACCRRRGRDRGCLDGRRLSGRGRSRLG